MQVSLSQLSPARQKSQEALRSDRPQKDKETQVELLQTQIQALQARIAELMRQRAEQAAQGKTDGPSAANRLQPRASGSQDAQPAVSAAVPPGVLAVA